MKPGWGFSGRGGLVSLAAVAVGAVGLAGQTAEPNLTRELREHVTVLCDTIGPRAMFRGDSLKQTADYISSQLEREGWTVRRLGYTVSGVTCENLEVERRGTVHPDEIVVIGAHYDSVIVTPGADDNASGVAALLALAKEFGKPNRAPQRTLRFVAFVNEEPIYFQSRLMGSRVYAQACKQRGDRIVAMLSLESIGYFSEKRGTQFYPSFWLGLFLPSRGNFLAFVGNKSSKALVADVTKAFKSSKTLPSESVALNDSVQGVGWSDHWSFWQEGYPALMVTDTATFRNPHYHQPTDKPETLNFPMFTSAVIGLRRVVGTLAQAPE
jgi:Zn-dependent M28 family amino/carboxypeptidase